MTDIRAAVDISTVDTDSLTHHAAVVREVRRETDDVVTIGIDIPAALSEHARWEPGSHIGVSVGTGLTRHYSLVPSPAPAQWRIAVRKQEGSARVSPLMHALTVGSTIGVSAPRSAFPLRPATGPRLFIAGGIGITPILSMLDAAEAEGCDWRLIYLGRSRASLPFLGELERFGDRILVLPKSEVGPIDLRRTLDEVIDAVGFDRAATQLYVCGPGRLLDEVLGLGLDPQQVHVERFTAGDSLAEAESAAFVVELADGREVVVASDQTILEAVEEVGVRVLSSCREGVCGTCETTVLEGVPEHRDVVLSDAERRSNETMMICVSRCLGGRLVLDL